MPKEMSSLQELLAMMMPENSRGGVYAGKPEASYADLRGVLESTPEGLMKVGMPEIEAQLLAALPGIARRCCAEREGARPFLGCYGRAEEYIRGMYLGRHVEQFALICLDSEFCLAGSSVFMDGTRREHMLPRRQLSRVVLEFDARYALICHNHPGGSPIFSQTDCEATMELMVLLQDVGAALLDHILVYSGGMRSLRRSRVIEERVWNQGQPGQLSEDEWFGSGKKKTAE